MSGNHTSEKARAHDSLALF